MMRIKRLPILASVLLLAACTADFLTQQTGEADSQAQKAAATRLVHYRATVNDKSGSGQTRATLDTDGKYIYDYTDMLFIRSTGADEGRVYGALMLNPQDKGKSSGVTFEGDLHLVGFEESEEPPADMPLEAVLVGRRDKLYAFNDQGDQITGLEWPQDGGLVATLAQAVERFSTLTAQSTYGKQSFQLSQGSCFVEFSVTLDDDTPADDEFGAYVWTDTEQTGVRTGTVKTVQDGEVVKAKFVAAFPGGTILDGAVVGLDQRNPIGFGGTESKTLEANKVYHVNRTFTREARTINFDETSLVKSHPDASFPIEVINDGDGAVTYASDDEDVATVAYDEMSDQWMVTITGAGETDLKATVADGPNSVYSEHTVSCHLKVYDPVTLASTTASHVGWIIGTDGLAYITSSGIEAANATPVAVIGYVGNPGTVDASSTTYRGLAVALNDATATSVTWSSANIICTTNPCDDDEMEFLEIVAEMTGIDNTARLAGYECRSGSEDTHTHVAATAASGYGIWGFTPSSIGCSPWFLPSTGQWFKVFGGCGVATSQWTDLGYCPDSEGKMPNESNNHCADNYTAIQRLMTVAGGTLGDRYWTSTENAFERFAFYVSFDTSGVNMMVYPKTSTCNVRPFIAF